MRFIRVLFKSFVDFFKDGGIMLAASLSYFAMMAIVPFCLFLVTIFAYFLGEHQAFYKFFVAKLISFFPKITHEITEELRKIITFKGLGKFSLILYGFLSYQFFSSMESAINVIFKIKKKRAFIISLFLSLVVVTLIIAFLLISFSATSIIPLLKVLKEFFPALKIGKITSFLIRFVVPFFLVLFTVISMYILLPKRRIKFFHAFSGALFTAILLEIAKHLFTWYVGSVTKLGTIYGPLSAFVVFLVWIFYSSCIFLIGGEIVHNLGDSKGD